MKNLVKHIRDTYPNSGWDGAGCQHIPWGDWHIMVDTDDGKIRIGGYELDENREIPELHTIWIEIPEDRDGLAVVILEGLTDSLPTPVAL